MPIHSVANDLGAVGVAVEWADQFFEAMMVSGSRRADIQVCLEEALANLILHGQCPTGDKAIIVSLDHADDLAAVTISDCCTPFDVARAPLPEVHPLGDIPGGHGLRLIRRLSTRVTYDTGADGNELRMYFGPAGATADGDASQASGS